MASWLRNSGTWAKKLSSKATIPVGSIGFSSDFMGAFRGDGSTPSSMDELHRRLDRGDFDLVAVGRALLSDAGWTRKIHEGRSTELIGFGKDSLATIA